VIAAFALIKYIFAPQQTAHRAAVRRSRSCSALHDLHNKQQAIDACAEMFERFEERCPGGWRTRHESRLAQKLPALAEAPEAAVESCTNCVPLRRRAKSLPAALLDELPAFSLHIAEWEPLCLGTDSPPPSLGDASLSDDDGPPTLQMSNNQVELFSHSSANSSSSLVEGAFQVSDAAFEGSDAVPTRHQSREEPDPMAEEAMASGVHKLTLTPREDLPALALDAGEELDWAERDPSPTGGSLPDVWASSGER